MSDVTGADMQQAAAALNYGPREQVSPMDAEYVEAIAQALADERERARAPFLAVLADWESMAAELPGWEITVQVPEEAGQEAFDRICEAVWDAATDAEPADREGWDVFCASIKNPVSIPAHAIRRAAKESQ